MNKATNGICFIVMPFGRTEEEVRWYEGWYKEAIKPAVEEAEFEPVLSATEETPSAINDEIRRHLAFDPMVVVDLAGFKPSDPPNPNVMYELGIRHAMNLPVVMMAWKGQKLPFDVGNQRAIMEDRDFLSLKENRDKLVAFIVSAAAGEYYKPMDAVGRTATLEFASDNLGEDSVLGALVGEVEEVKHILTQREGIPKLPPPDSIKGMATRQGGNRFRKALYAFFVDIGGETHEWPKILHSKLTPEDALDAENWDFDEWKLFVQNELDKLRSGNEIVVASSTAETVVPESDGSSRPMRIYELARELGVASKDILAQTRSLGLEEIKSHMSQISVADQDRVKKLLDQATST